MSRLPRPTLGGLLLLAATAAAAGEPVPYSAIYGALEPAARAQRYPRLLAVPRIESKLPGVAPDDVRIEIVSRSGTREVRPAADGQVDFPLSKALLDENPSVRTNQPRGSLTLTVTLALRAPAGKRFATAELVDALADAERLLAEAPDPEGRSIRGAELRFAPGSDARVTLHGELERLLAADADGRVLLLRDRDLGASTREIEWTHAPEQILPWLSE